jgi:hypothetical protein
MQADGHGCLIAATTDHSFAPIANEPVEARHKNAANRERENPTEIEISS